jgi:hypothetical protein
MMRVKPGFPDSIPFAVLHNSSSKFDPAPCIFDVPNLK